MKGNNAGYSAVPNNSSRNRIDSDNAPMISSLKTGSAKRSSMTSEGDNHATSYSKWDSTSESVQLDMKNDGKGGCLATLSWKRWLVLVIGVGVLALVFGFIFGYLTRRAYHLKDNEERSQSTLSPPLEQVASQKSQRYSEKAFNELSEKISTDSIKQYINEYVNSGTTYHAGSTAINSSAQEMTEGFCKSLGIILKQVTYSKVLLSRPGAENSANYQIAKSGSLTYTKNVENGSPDTMKPFVAYTASGQAQGPAVYAGYGRRNDDFDVSVDYNNSICFMRYGKLSPFYMITHAAERGCIGAVLYPDPQEFTTLEQTDRIISNAKRLAGDPQTPGWPDVSANAFRLPMDELRGKYLPPGIPVISASQEMVKPVLQSLLGNDSSVDSGDKWPAAFTEGQLQKEPSVDTEVTLSVSNTLPKETIYRSVCAERGTVDSDKFVMVGTHHDEAGSGHIDPATGQAIMREMMRLLTAYSDIYKPRKSIIFLTKDASYLDISTQEFIEENRREYGERAVAYVSINSALSKGSVLHVKSSAPLQHFMNEIMSASPDVEVVKHSEVIGPKHYRAYNSQLGAPILEMGFSNKVEDSGVDALPVCCSNTQPYATDERVRFVAKTYLKVIMRLAGETILPYNLDEIKDLYNDGVMMIIRNDGKADPKLVQDLTKTKMMVNFLLPELNNKLLYVNHSAIDDVSVRRVNDALTGITRSCILSQGVPMLDPSDPTKVIRNINNRNLLVGSVSTNEYDVVPFPGLQELFSVESPSQEVQNEINKHIGDIISSMVDAMDYSKRAIMDSATFPTNQN